jgi:predicted metalloprotease with PDZ domain
MNDVTPYDWRTFFTTRLNAVATGAPLGGITNGGWKLIYTDQQSDYQKALEEANKVVDLSYSVGFKLGEDGGIGDVVMGTPAYAAGLGPGMKIIAVNGDAFTVQSVREAIRSAKGPANAIELLIQNGPSLKTYRIDYHGGERYPHLERDSTHPDLIQQIIKPVKPRK